MGLTAWKGEVVRKADVTVAKNYLSQEEIGELNRIVTMWLDFAEDQARRRIDSRPGPREQTTQTLTGGDGVSLDSALAHPPTTGGEPCFARQEVLTSRQ